MNKIRPIRGRMHFYTPFGVVRIVQFGTAPSLPLTREVEKIFDF